MAIITLSPLQASSGLFHATSHSGTEIKPTLLSPAVAQRSGFSNPSLPYLRENVVRGKQLLELGLEQLMNSAPSGLQYGFLIHQSWKSEDIPEQFLSLFNSWTLNHPVRVCFGGRVPILAALVVLSLLCLSLYFFLRHSLFVIVCLPSPCLFFLCCLCIHLFFSSCFFPCYAGCPSRSLDRRR